MFDSLSNFIRAFFLAILIFLVFFLLIFIVIIIFSFILGIAIGRKQAKRNSMEWAEEKDKGYIIQRKTAIWNEKRVFISKTSYELLCEKLSNIGISSKINMILNYEGDTIIVFEGKGFVASLIYMGIFDGKAKYDFRFPVVNENPGKCFYGMNYVLTLVEKVFQELDSSLETSVENGEIHNWRKKESASWEKKTNRFFIFLRRLFAVISVIIVLFIIVYGIFFVQKLHKMGWRLKNNIEEIVIEDSSYEKAIECLNNKDYENSENYYLDSLNYYDNKNGKGSVESAVICQNIGKLYLEEGKYSEAYEYLNSAYITFRNEYGEEDGNTISAKGLIAVYDIKTGNMERGFATLDELYDTATYYKTKMQIFSLLAQCYSEQGEYSRALEFYNLLYTYYTYWEIYDIEWVNFWNNYGLLMIQVMNYQDAIDSFNRAIIEWEKLDIKEDNTLASIYANLAQAYALNNQEKEAIEMFEKSLALYKELYGENSIYVAMSYDSLANIYEIMGDYDKQKDYLDKAFNMALNTVGENHMYTAMIAYDSGNYWYNMGDLDQAIQYHNKSLDIRKNILGVENVNTVFVYEALANDYKNIEDYDTAIENAEYAVQISESLFGRENLFSAHTYITISSIYSEAGDFEKALWFSDMAIDICDREKEYSGSIRPLAYLNAGNIYLNKKDYENSQKYLEKTLLLYSKYEGRDYIEEAQTHISLSDVYYYEGDKLKSNDELDNALDVMLEHPMPQNMSNLIDLRKERLNEQN